MDATWHTIIATGMLAISFYVGRYFGTIAGHEIGIEYCLSYLLHYGAVTEEGVARANELYDRDMEQED